MTDIDNSTDSGPDLGPLDVSGSSPPANYTVPEFPGLYWPWEDGEYLYYSTSIWKFTVYWELILLGGTFLFPALISFIVFSRKSKRHFLYSLSLPFIFMAIAAFLAIVSATIIGFAVAAVYTAGMLRTSTWVPFLWAVAQTLIVIINSYSTVTSML